MTKSKPENHHPALDAQTPLTLGERAADAVAATVGSWKFLMIQSSLIGAWVVWNSVSGHAFDPYPFILLNLAMSFQAAYTAPVIMMSQNRDAQIDRRRAIADYDVNTTAEGEIKTLHSKIDALRREEIAQLHKAIERIEAALAKNAP